LTLEVYLQFEKVCQLREGQFAKINEQSGGRANNRTDQAPFNNDRVDLPRPLKNEQKILLLFLRLPFPAQTSLANPATSHQTLALS